MREAEVRQKHLGDSVMGPRARDIFPTPVTPQELVLLDIWMSTQWAAQVLSGAVGRLTGSDDTRASAALGSGANHHWLSLATSSDVRGAPKWTSFSSPTASISLILCPHFWIWGKKKLIKNLCLTKNRSKLIGTWCSHDLRGVCCIIKFTLQKEKKNP